VLPLTPALSPAGGEGEFKGILDRISSGAVRKWRGGSGEEDFNGGASLRKDYEKDEKDEKGEKAPGLALKRFSLKTNRGLEASGL
jgi:hypothetical protein